MFSNTIYMRLSLGLFCTITWTYFVYTSRNLRLLTVE